MQGVRGAIRFLRIPFARDCQLEKHNPLVQRTAHSVLVRSAWRVSEFSEFGSSLPGCNGSHLHNYGSMSRVEGLCSQPTLQGEETKQKKRPSGDPQKLYNDIVASLEKKVMPFPKVLQELIRSSSTASEVALAMRAAELLRIFRTVELGEKGNHTKEFSHMMVAAYLRAGDTHNALKLLWRQNAFGFPSSLGSAHLLLKHSKFHKDMKLMRRILRAMEANDIRATQTTADIILRQCKEAGEKDLMFSLAKNYNKQGLRFHESLFDVLISSAANTGDVKFVHEIQDWRDKQGLLHTTASAVSMAKALVLESKPKDAAMVIKDHCPDGEKRERYLSILVKVWPLQLITSLKVETKDEYLQKLKEDVVSMFDSFKELGLAFSIDVSKDFAQGKGSDSKAQKEVKSSSSEETEDV